MSNRIVTKALACIEDLLLGTGTVNQTRNGVTVPMTKIDAAGLIYENAETLRTRFGKKVDVLTNVAALQLLDTTNAAETFVYLLGYTTAGDGGGGLFWLDSTDTTTTEDLNIVFNPDVLANGRWKRVDTNSYTSSDRGDADYAIQAFDYGIQQYNTTLTANRTVTLPTSGLYKGKRVSVLRSAGGSFNLLVGTITTLTGAGLVELQYNGSAWIVLSEPASSAASSDAFNGSFEIDENNDGQPDNWSAAPLLLGTIAIDSTDSAHGLNSLKFLSGNNGGGSETSKRFDVEKLDVLGVNFTYKSSVVNSLNKVEVQTYDKDGLAVSLLPAYSEAAANPTTYEAKKVKVTIPATAVTAELVLTGIDAASTVKSAGTTTHFDNIYFTDPVPLKDNIPVYGMAILPIPILMASGSGGGSVTATVDMTSVYGQAETDGAKVAILKCFAKGPQIFNTLYVGEPSVLVTSAAFVAVSASGDTTNDSSDTDTVYCPLDANSDFKYAFSVASASTEFWNIYLVGYYV